MEQEDKKDDQVAAEDFQKGLKDTIKCMVTKACGDPDTPSEQIKFYNSLLKRDKMLEMLLSHYFSLTEGWPCCEDKARFVLSKINETIGKGEYQSLKMTYREYKDSGHDIGNIQELDDVCY